MSSVPPISLQNLYVDLDYLSGIHDNQKYNFSGRYYSNDDWLGYVLRKFGGESQDVYGIACMENICKNAAEQWDTYKDNKIFNSTLLNKIVAARHGLERCRKTYETKQKTHTSTSITNRAILILDSAIPYDRKISEGIILENKLRVSVEKQNKEVFVEV